MAVVKSEVNALTVNSAYQALGKCLANIQHLKSNITELEGKAEELGQLIRDRRNALVEEQGREPLLRQGVCRAQDLRAEAEASARAAQCSEIIKLQQRREALLQQLTAVDEELQKK